MMSSILGGVIKNVNSFTARLSNGYFHKIKDTLILRFGAE